MAVVQTQNLPQLSSFFGEVCIMKVLVVMVAVVMASPIYFHWLWSWHCAGPFTHI